MDKVGKLLNERGPNPHRYIIMDNCPIHNRENLRNIEELHNLKIIYLPPYTPMLNPIEYWFNEVKSHIRQKTYKTRL
jgi:transposase